ncbi:hypothetical protein FACS1894217_15920 [Clostridia bacterium]|nr:hypothetical protein FACS1894217_15920 [Clostridia bacterium]
MLTEQNVRDVIQALVDKPLSDMFSALYSLEADNKDNPTMLAALAEIRKQANKISRISQLEIPYAVMTYPFVNSRSK